MDFLSSPDTDWDSIKTDLARRIREVRQDLYGEHGGPLLARKLRITYREFHDYESGGTVPAHSILRLIEHTKVNPHWLLTGEGDKFLDGGSCQD